MTIDWVDSKTVRWLELRQRHAYRRFPELDPNNQSAAQIERAADKVVSDANPGLTQDELEPMIRAYRAHVAEVFARRPTPYEDPFGYSIMTNLVRGVERAIADRKLPLDRRPFFGTLPTGQVNAFTVLCRDTPDYVVLFDRQLFQFALLFSKAVARALPFRQDASGFSTASVDIKERIDSDPSIRYRFKDVVVNYALHGTPAAAEQYAVEPQYFQLSTLLLMSLEYFVIGHEFAHIILRHLEEPLPRSRPTNGLRVDGITFDWDQEYAADEMGAFICLVVMALEQGSDHATSLWGAALFFEAIDVMDRAVSVLRYGEEREFMLGSHPPTRERAARLRDLVGKGVSPDMARDAQGLAAAVETSVSSLWTAVRPDFVALHKKGRRPAPVWD